MGKVKRSKFMVFLNVAAAGATTPTYELMGEGITGQTINYNPQTLEEVYIHQDSGATEVSSYKPTIPTPQTAVQGDKVFDYVDGLRKKRAVLSEARTSLVMVYAYEDAVSGAYPAEACECSIQVDTFGGDGGAQLSINYTVNLIGDPKTGVFDPKTKAFTESAAA